MHKAQGKPSKGTGGARGGGRGRGSVGSGRGRGRGYHTSTADVEQSCLETAKGATKPGACRTKTIDRESKPTQEATKTARGKSRTGTCGGETADAVCKAAGKAKERVDGFKIDEKPTTKGGRKKVEKGIAGDTECKVKGGAREKAEERATQDAECKATGRGARRKVEEEKSPEKSPQKGRQSESFETSQYSIAAGLDRYFKDNVSLSRKHIGDAAFKVNQVVDTLEREMCKSEKFLLKRFNTGSYYEKTKVERPDEMDCMFIFKGQDEPQKFFSCVPPRSSASSHIFVDLERVALPSGSNFQRWRKYLTSDGKRLCPEKLYREFKELVKETVDKVWTPDKVKIKGVEGTRGPAVTLRIDKDIDVDIVLGIHFDGWPQNVQSMFSLQEKQNRWINDSVKDELKGNGYDVVVKTVGSEFKFRLSFSRAEKYLLTNTQLEGCEKMCLRIGKLILSEHKDHLRPLCSYHLKTILLTLRYQHPTKKYWEKEKLSDRFNEFMQAVIKGVGKGKIPNFFVTRHNLMNDWNEYDVERVTNELPIIYKKLVQSLE